METPEQYTVKTPELPEKIFPVDYAGFWDFSSDGCYGPSLLNVEDFPHCGQIAQEISNRYNGYSELIKENERLREENKELRDRLHTANNQCQGLLSKQADDFVKMYKPFKEENKLYREALTKASNFISVFLTKMPDRLIPSDWTDAMFAGVKEMNSVLSKFQPKKDESTQ